MAKIWFLIRDPGGLNGAMPVIKALKKYCLDLEIIASGTSAKILTEQADEPFTYCEDPKILLLKKSPNIIVSTIASNGGTPRDIIPLLGETFIEKVCQTVLLDEYYGAGFSLEWKDPRYRTDYVTGTNDDLSEKLILYHWNGYSKERIIRTGYPSLDRYAEINVDKVRQETRKKLQLQDNIPLIVFLGQDTFTGNMFLELIHVLHGLNFRAYLAPRLHPRMMRGEWQEDKSFIDDVMHEHSRKKSSFSIYDSSSIDTSSMIASADLVLSMDTTALMDACVLRKQNISIYYPEVHKMRKAQNYTFLNNEPPTVTLGCTAKATCRDELSSLVKKALTIGLGLSETQKRVYSLDGKNAERVAEFLRSLL